MPRGVTLALVVLGGACVVFAALALGGRASQTAGARGPTRWASSSRSACVAPDRAAERAVPAVARPATDLSPRETSHFRRC